MAEKTKAPTGERRGLRQHVPPSNGTGAESSAGGDDDQDDGIAVEGFKPLLPEGQWFEAKCIGWGTALMFMAPKAFLEFEIVEPGEHFGVRLFRAFRVRRLVGRPGPKGKFVLAANGDLYQLLVKLQGVGQRADRITIRPLKAMLLKIRTRTVKINSRQEPLPEHGRYSVIDAIDRGE